MNDEYVSIEENSYSIDIKRSKFISRSFSVCNESEAKILIDSVKKKFHDAKHNVYAFSLLSGVSRSSDDGEPSGTAGVQVLNVLNQFNLKNNIILVTRYFGGILLGTGGLSRAYFSCAEKLVKNSKMIYHYISDKFETEISYKEYNLILKLNKFKIENVVFDKNVIVTFSVRKSDMVNFKSDLENVLSRKIDINNGIDKSR